MADKEKEFVVGTIGRVQPRNNNRDGHLNNKYNSSQKHQWSNTYNNDGKYSDYEDVDVNWYQQSPIMASMFNIIKDKNIDIDTTKQQEKQQEKVKDDVSISDNILEQSIINKDNIVNTLKQEMDNTEMKNENLINTNEAINNSNENIINNNFEQPQNFTSDIKGLMTDDYGNKIFVSYTTRDENGNVVISNTLTEEQLEELKNIEQQSNNFDWFDGVEDVDKQSNKDFKVNDNYVFTSDEDTELSDETHHKLVDESQDLVQDDNVIDAQISTNKVQHQNNNKQEQTLDEQKASNEKNQQQSTLSKNSQIEHNKKDENWHYIELFKITEQLKNYIKENYHIPPKYQNDEKLTELIFNNFIHSEIGRLDVENWRDLKENNKLHLFNYTTVDPQGNIVHASKGSRLDGTFLGNKLERWKIGKSGYTTKPITFRPKHNGNTDLTSEQIKEKQEQVDTMQKRLTDCKEHQLWDMYNGALDKRLDYFKQQIKNDKDPIQANRAINFISSLISNRYVALGALVFWPSTFIYLGAAFLLLKSFNFLMVEVKNKQRKNRLNKIKDKVQKQVQQTTNELKYRYEKGKEYMLNNKEKEQNKEFVIEPIGAMSKQQGQFKGQVKQENITRDDIASKLNGDRGFDNFKPLSDDKSKDKKQDIDKMSTTHKSKSNDKSKEKPKEKPKDKIKYIEKNFE